MPDIEFQTESHCDCRSGVVSVPSGHSVADTVTRLHRLLGDKGIKVFAVIDQASEARSVGLDMPATMLVVFGNPKAGTPLMLASPTIAIDLPLKLLVTEDDGGKARISYVAPDRLRARHDVPANLAPVLEAVETLAMAASRND